jgi:hypothetical protein
MAVFMGFQSGRGHPIVPRDGVPNHPLAVDQALAAGLPNASADPLDFRDGL